MVSRAGNKSLNLCSGCLLVNSFYRFILFPSSTTLNPESTLHSHKRTQTCIGRHLESFIVVSDIGNAIRFYWDEIKDKVDNSLCELQYNDNDLVMNMRHCRRRCVAGNTQNKINFQ